MLPGFEIFHHSIANNLKSKNEAIVAIFHYILVSNEYKFIGLDEKFQENAKDLKGSEILPENWNENPFFIMKYVKPAKQDLLLVKIIPSDKILLINVLFKKEDQVLATTIDSSEIVTDHFKEFDRMFVDEKSLENFVRFIHKELVDKFGVKEPDTQRIRRALRDEILPDDSPLLIDQNRRPAVHPQSIPATMPYPRIGGADLDPLGRGIGGGMMVDLNDLRENFRNPPSPFNIFPRDPRGLDFNPSAGLDRSLPPGAVPPGARFDPFGPPGMEPPNTNRSNRQNHPDLGYDDMFY